MKLIARLTQVDDEADSVVDVRGDSHDSLTFIVGVRLTFEVTVWFRLGIYILVTIATTCSIITALCC